MFGFGRKSSREGQGAQRDQENIILYLSPRQPTPPLPYELQGHIHPDEWDARIPKIVDVSSQFFKPLFEKIWMFLGVISIIVLPVALYQVLFNVLVKKNNTNNNTDGTPAGYFEARALSFGIFIATFLIFVVPIAIWKFIGRRRVAFLLSGWEKRDRSTRPSGAFVPNWKVKIPGLFTTQTVLKISLPPAAPATLFNPNAYVPPSLVNPPSDDHLPVYGSEFESKHFEDVKV